MPNRVIREGILESRAVNSLSEGAELFYRHLMSVVDDYGRIEYDPDVLLIRCFPRRLATWTVKRLTDACQETVTCLTDDGQPLVVCYRDPASGKRYLQINNFNQRLRLMKAKCPDPGGKMAVTCLTDDGHMTARNESESESESETKETPAAPALCTSVVEWPKTAAAVRAYFPATDTPMVLKIVTASVQRYCGLAPPGSGDLPDEKLAEAVAIAHFPKQHSAGAFVTKVPQVIQTWVEEDLRELASKNGRH